MFIHNRERALHEIAALAERYSLSLDDIAIALTPGAAATARVERNTAQTLVRILSYIGGVLIFAGLGIYIGMEWKMLSSFQRVLVTLGPGLIALIVAIACLKDNRFEKAATPLLLISAILQPTGLIIFLIEFFPPSPHPELAIGLIFLILAFQQGGLLLRYQRTSMAFFAIMFGFAGVEALLYWLHADMMFSAVVLSFAGMCLTRAISHSRYRPLAPWLFVLFDIALMQSLFALLSPLSPNWLMVVIGGMLAASVILQCLRVFVAPQALALFFLIVPYLFFLLAALGRLNVDDGYAILFIGLAGSVMGYSLRQGLHRHLTPILYLIFASMIAGGFYDIVKGTHYDVFLVGLGALMIYVSVILSSRMLLTVAVISLLGYLTYFTGRYFANVVGWPIALILLGIVLILISIYGVKLGRKITQAS